MTRWLLAVVLVGVASCSTCAPRQRVPIDSAPRDASIFVDGEDLGPAPLELDLRSDRDHTVFIKRPGYRPELVILETHPGERRPYLEPAEVRVRLVPIERGRDLEVSPDADDEVPVDPSFRPDR